MIEFIFSMFIFVFYRSHFDSKFTSKIGKVSYFISINIEAVYFLIIKLLFLFIEFQLCLANLSLLKYNSNALSINFTTYFSIFQSDS